MRGLLRQLSVHTAGTAAAPPALTQNVAGWGVAGHARIPMRWFSDAFGPDQLIGMAYYGRASDAILVATLSAKMRCRDLGLPGTTLDFSLDPLPTYGAVAAYRRFWTPQLRSNVSYAYAKQDYPSYALGFVPGSVSATSLNRDMQQVIANLIWSPFAVYRNGAVETGWLDVGLEYVFTQRDVFGGAVATGTAGDDQGVANRIVAAAIVRF